MKKIAVAGVAGLLAVMASCGGGGSKSLSEKEYVRALEKVCTTANKDFQDIADTEDYSDLSDAADQAISIVDDAIADIKDLKPPKDLQSDHEDFVAALEDVRSGFEDLRDAADDKDDDAISDAGDAITKASDNADDIADSIGADKCVGVGNDPDEPTPDSTVPSTDEPTTDAPTTDAPSTEPPSTRPTVTVPPIEMTMPPATEPPVSGTNIETFDFDQLITPSGYQWTNIDPDQLATIQSNLDTQFSGQIAAVGGASVDDLANGFTFNSFVFFWNEDDIVSSGTGITFLNVFTESAVSSADTYTDAGYPVTVWTDDDGAEGVGAIDGSLSIVLYGPSGSQQQLLAFFDAFINAQG